MRKLIIGLLSAVVLLAGCISPPKSLWYNGLYKSDRKNSMQKYYGRDFVICLGFALESANHEQPGSVSVEYETLDCLRKAGWVER